MKNSDLKKRTKFFAHRCVKLCQVLPANPLGKTIAGQLIRSSLSVASNYRAACLAQSKKEFASKISIVLEEADECLFWIEFISDEKLIESDRLAFIIK
jgi:four helix bundle protein